MGHPRPPSDELASHPVPRDRDPPPPPLAEVQAALKAVDWTEVLKQATAIAIEAWGVPYKEANKEMYDAATDLLLAAGTGKGRVWNPRKYPDLAAHLVWVGRSNRSTAQRKAARLVLMDPTAEEIHASPVNHPEQLLRKGASHVLGLERRAKGLESMPPLAREVFLAIEKGTFLPKKEFAARHGVTVAQVDAARQAMKYHLKKVIEADGVPPPSSGSRLGQPPAAPTRHDAGSEDDDGTGYES